MNYEDENNEQQNVENQRSHPVRERLSSAYDRYQDYNDLKEKYNANGLGGLARGMAQEAINNKVNQVKDKAKEKINGKKDELKNKAKDKFDSKLPDSVKQKRDTLKNKGQAIKDKAAATKDKFNNAKNTIKDAKKNLNENAFRRGVRAAVNAAAPGAGVAAEKMLDVGKGKKALDAARNASNPIAALKEGTKKLVEVVVTQEIKKKLIITLLPSCITIFMVVVVVLGIISKFTDSQTYAAGPAVGQGSGGIEEVDEKYKKFYENVEKYASSTDKYMVIAVLTAYKDNDDYSGTENCTTEEISSGECLAETIDGVTTYSKSKMKKYIKEVSDAIEDSNYDVTEGDYKDPYNTGSEFFKWLYSDFVEEYYGEFLPEAESDEKKKEIVKFIYLYYKDIKKYDDSLVCRNSYVNATCPQVTVTGNDAGVYSLEEYVEAVVAQELGYSGFPQAMRAQAIAARTYLLSITNNCTKSIENSQNAQTLNFSKVTDEVRQAVSDTAGLVLTKDGNVILSQYSNFAKDHTCSGSKCTGTFLKQPSHTNGTITIDVAKIGVGLTPGSLKGGHQWGMSQYGALYFDKVDGYNYEEILKYFYDDDVKISATSDSDGNNADHSASGEQVRLTVYGAQGSDVNLGVSVSSSRISSNSNGWRFYRDDDGKDYLIIATATEECLKSNSCASSETRYSSIKYYSYYDKIVLSIKGVEYDAIVLDSCGACMKEKSDRGDTTNNRIDIWIDASVENNNTHGIGDYDGVVFDDKTIAAKGVCGASGNGLVTVDGYVQRISRPQVNNSYYYVQSTPSNGNSWGAAGTLEGECAWYATGRAKEVLSTLNNGGSWTYNGNGNSYCNAPEVSNFQTSKDPTKPKPGAIVSWSSGKYGHVAIVESVNGNRVTISEAGLGYGPTAKYMCSNGECIRGKIKNDTITRHQYCEADGSGCFNTRTVDIDKMDTLSGTFNCYVYLTDPK